MFPFTELPKGFFLNFGNPTTFLDTFGMDHFESVFMGLINFSMSLFPLKYVLELYLVIILFDAIILVYFFCYVHMAFLCHFISSVKLKKKAFSFPFPHFANFFSLCPLPCFSKACSLLCYFPLDFHFCDTVWGWPKSSFTRYYEKTQMNFWGNPIVSLNPDSLFLSVTISLWKLNSLLSPEAPFWASLLLPASISDFSWFPQRWPLPHFSPSCCFLAGEVGKDQLFQIGHSNCIMDNLTSLLYSDWLLSLQDSQDQPLLTSLASFSLFFTLSTVNSLVSFPWKPSIFPSSRLWIILLCLSSALYLDDSYVSSNSQLKKSPPQGALPDFPSWCSTTLSSLQCSAPVLLVLGVRTLRYLPPCCPNTVQAVTRTFQ